MRKIFKTYDKDHKIEAEISTDIKNINCMIHSYKGTYLCSGLVDKNGELMYEGDILRNEDGGISTVILSDGQFLEEYRNKDGGVSGYTQLSDDDDQGYGWELEIIGNIVENPELLPFNKNKE